MNKQELERVILLNSQKPHIFCKICGKDITNGWKTKENGKFVDKTTEEHVRLRHLGPKFYEYFKEKGETPPTEESFLEVREVSPK